MTDTHTPKHITTFNTLENDTEYPEDDANALLAAFFRSNNDAYPTNPTPISPVVIKPVLKTIQAPKVKLQKRFKKFKKFKKLSPQNDYNVILTNTRTPNKVQLKTSHNHTKKTTTKSNPCKLRKLDLMIQQAQEEIIAESKIITQKRRKRNASFSFSNRKQPFNSDTTSSKQKKHLLTPNLRMQLQNRQEFIKKQSHKNSNLVKKLNNNTTFEKNKLTKPLEFHFSSKIRAKQRIKKMKQKEEKIIVKATIKPKHKKLGKSQSQVKIFKPTKAVGPVFHTDSRSKARKEYEIERDRVNSKFLKPKVKSPIIKPKRLKNIKNNGAFIRSKVSGAIKNSKRIGFPLSLTVNQNNPGFMDHTMTSSIREYNSVNDAKKKMNISKLKKKRRNRSVSVFDRLHEQKLQGNNKDEMMKKKQELQKKDSYIKRSRKRSVSSLGTKHVEKQLMKLKLDYINSAIGHQVNEKVKINHSKFVKKDGNTCTSGVGSVEAMYVNDVSKVSLDKSQDANFEELAVELIQKEEKQERGAAEPPEPEHETPPQLQPQSQHDIIESKSVDHNIQIKNENDTNPCTTEHKPLVTSEIDYLLNGLVPESKACTTEHQSSITNDIDFMLSGLLFEINETTGLNKSNKINKNCSDSTNGTSDTYISIREVGKIDQNVNNSVTFNTDDTGPKNTASVTLSRNVREHGFTMNQGIDYDEDSDASSTIEDQLEHPLDFMNKM